MPRTLLLYSLLFAALPAFCIALPPPNSAGVSAPVDLTTQREHALPNAAAAEETAAGRRLNGRFLHITDIHPDPYYKVYSSTDQGKACHRGKGPAGYYGAETSDCDTPISLLNETFAWINATLRDEIDFVIWTGDSARHDNDEHIPRNEKQVTSQNELVVSKFRQVFGKPGHNFDEPDADDDPTNDFRIPIIPTFGNNDILPHNIFTEGPNHWTQKYLSIWRQFIPEAQRHQFARGGWYYVEVIPSKLAVFSLNTLYFFASNSAVDGCARKSEPGYEQMEWLRVQLELLRQRGVKAILTGHVPPARVDAKTSWDESCWQKYALWLERYRDVIVSSIWGHMNIDHFLVQDFKDIKRHVKKGLALTNVSESGLEDEMTLSAASDYLVDLRGQFAKIPPVLPVSAVEEYEQDDKTFTQRVLSFFGTKKDESKRFKKIGGPYAERYSVSLVGASVVPNYFPSFRVVEYNISGLESITLPNRLQPSVESDEVAGSMSKSRKQHDDDDDEHIDRKKKRYKFTVPKGPSKSSPPGPAYSPQTLTLKGYTQYYANLTHINNDFPPSSLEEDGDDEMSGESWKNGKHKGKTKQGQPQPKKFKYQVEYSTMDKHDIYKMEDLTVRSWLRLARRIAGRKPGDLAEDEEEAVEAERKKERSRIRGKIKNKVWFEFIKRAFVGAKDPEEIEGEFGVFGLYGEHEEMVDGNFEL